MTIEIKSKEIKMLPLAQLKPYHKNRNTHPEKQIERLAKLYEGHGFRDPLIVCEDTMQIIAGNGRAQAAKIAGMTEVPVILQKFADEDARYAFMVSHNAIADWAELDLSGINADLGDLGPDFDLELLGLENFVIEPADKFLEDFEEPAPKDGPSTKETELRKCPNCGTMVG